MSAAAGGFSSLGPDITERLSRARGDLRMGVPVVLAGEGEAGPPGTPPGDLYVEVRVKPHPIFQREGVHLFCRVPVSMPTAALGGEALALGGIHHCSFSQGLSSFF